MKPIRRTKTAGALALTLLALTGCSYTRYTEPTDTETMDSSYGRTDLQKFASEMVEKLEASPRLASYAPPEGAGGRLKVVLGGIQNRTGEHLDTTGIVDKIENALVNGGRFTVLAGDMGQVEVGEEQRFQNEAGRVLPEEARDRGRQLGAQIIVYGALRQIEKDRGRSIESLGSKTEDVYYQFNLRCADVETAEILWSHEIEISKFERISLFGRG